MAKRNRAIGGFILRNGIFTTTLIRSVQRGTITLTDSISSNTATLSTAVDLSRSFVQLVGITSTSAISSEAEKYVAVSLTNTTTVTAVRTVNGGPGGAVVVVSYEVLSFIPGVIRTVQQTTIPIANGNSVGTQAITSVNTNKAILVDGGTTNTSAAGGLTDTWVRWDITSATQLTANRLGTGSDLTSYITVVEYW